MFPEWAAAYNHTNEKGHFTTRNKIIQAVKPLFAMAVFGEREQTPSGVDADTAPERALALIAATVDADTQAKIAAVIRAAGA